MSDPRIEIIPTSYQEVLDLLHSDALQAVERRIADAVKMRIVEDYSTTSTTYTQAEISVAGLTVAEIASLLDSKRDVLIRFGAALLRDPVATDDSEEFPPGEAQDPSELVESHGLGVGFGNREGADASSIAVKDLRSQLNPACACTADPQLAELIAVWRTISPHGRQAILTLANAAGGMPYRCD